MRVTRKVALPGGYWPLREACFSTLGKGYLPGPPHRQQVDPYSPNLTCSLTVPLILHTLHSPLVEGLPQTLQGTASLPDE